MDESDSWTILSNHGHALVWLDLEPDIRMWDLAQRVGVRERSMQRIVADLIASGYVTRNPHPTLGNRVTYTVHREKGLRRMALSRVTVGELIDLIAPGIFDPAG
jgi:DNA-binding MarR family transcriptional regulator